MQKHTSITVFTAALLLISSVQAALWGGADLRTNGLDLHVGKSLLAVPILATAGVEGGLGYSTGNSGKQVHVGVTLRDINLPFSSTDAYVSTGVSYHTATKNGSSNGLGLYTEGGVSGNLLSGPLGWRAGIRSDSKTGLSAGIGVEVKF